MWRQTRILGELRWYWDEGDTPRRRRFFREIPKASRVVVTWPDVESCAERRETRGRFAQGLAGPPTEPLERTRARAVLGLPREFEARDLARAYRALAFKHHPDRGGDDEALKAINWAASVLRG